MGWPGTGTRSPVSVPPTVTSVTWTRSVRWSRGTTSLSTPRRGPRWTPPRPRNPRRSWLTPLAPATGPSQPGRPVHVWCRSRPTTSSTGRRPRPTPQITPRHRARRTAGRRRRVSGRCGGRSCFDGRANSLAIRQSRAELRQDDAAPRKRARDHLCGRRPDGPADLDPRPLRVHRKAPEKPPALAVGRQGRGLRVALVLHILFDD